MNVMAPTGTLVSEPRSKIDALRNFCMNSKVTSVVCGYVQFYLVFPTLPLILTTSLHIFWERLHFIMDMRVHSQIIIGAVSQYINVILLA